MRRALAVIAIFAIAYLRLQGRVWWCACGGLSPVSLHVQSMHNSQHLFDIYSFSHVLHGLLLFGFFWLAARNWSTGWRFVAAMALEFTWEMVENSPAIISRYRATTTAMGYTGDSIANSLGDVLSCAAGFFLARRLGLRWSIVLFFVSEIFMMLAIRDNLALNVLMLVRPIEAVKKWQAGG